MSLPTVGFVGMTHLGLISATAIAAKGFPAVCYDPDGQLIDELSRGKLPVVEPDLPELLATNGKTQRFTADIKALAGCDVVYIAPDVPTDDTGQSDLTGIRKLIDAAAAALGPKAVMVILSQVPPGFTRSLGILSPERLYYQVETLVFGRAIERAMQPERYIVGCADPGKPLAPNFEAVLKAFGCPILPMRYESAELAKISINMCLVASVTVANTLAELCERIGADWSEIAPALKLDRRIGQYSYLAPGLGIAGGNLERDLATVERFAAKHHTDAGVVRAWVANSRHRRDWAAQTIRRVLLDANPKATLAVWGLAYKENTHSIKNSPSLATIAQLGGAKVRAHDPSVPQISVASLPIERIDDPLKALHGADALLILTPWPQYKKIPVEQIAAALKGRVVIDPYSVLDLKASEHTHLLHHTLGRPVLGRQTA
jgi:UDPglucose 6-dehydrogenase